MFDMIKRLRRLFAPRLTPPPPKLRRAVLQVEILEDRWCPAGTWTWVAATGMNSFWSNPTGLNWQLNGAPVLPGEYPGRMATPKTPGSFNDAVLFNKPGTDTATLDVPLNPLNALQFNGWLSTLTFDPFIGVTVTGGTFALMDTSMIELGASGSLELLDAQASLWTGGIIDGGANASLSVSGTTLSIMQDASILNANLTMQESVLTKNVGEVMLVAMASNLSLDGAQNSITVGNGGFLNLNQTISGPGLQNQEGGIVAGSNQSPGNVLVTVNPGGALARLGGPANPGTVNQVLIGGPVVNTGGEVSVLNGLDISGTNAEGDSYWQTDGANAQLIVGQGGNITAAGRFSIDTGLERFADGWHTV